MIEAEEHNSFFFADKKIKNIKELLEILQNPEHIETAKQYVTDSRNDYANWIREVLKEESLAEKISKEKNIYVIVEIIKEGIKNTPESQHDSKSVKEGVNGNKSDIFGFNMEKYGEEKKGHDKSDLHLDASAEHHKTILKRSSDSRVFCPKFFDCMKKEFLFGLGLGIIVGIVVAIFIKIGSI